MGRTTTKSLNLSHWFHPFFWTWIWSIWWILHILLQIWSIITLSWRNYFGACLSTKNSWSTRLFYKGTIYRNQMPANVDCPWEMEKQDLLSLNKPRHWGSCQGNAGCSRGHENQSFWDNWKVLGFDRCSFYEEKILETYRITSGRMGINLTRNGINLTAPDPDLSILQICGGRTGI